MDIRGGDTVYNNSNNGTNKHWLVSLGVVIEVVSVLQKIMLYKSMALYWP